MPEPDDSRAIENVLSVLRSALDRGRELGSSGAELLGSGADDAVRALVARRVERAMRIAPETVDTARLAAALEPSSSVARVAGRAGSIGRRVARNSRIARAVSRRTPAGMALRWGPLVVDVVRTNLRAVDAVAVHLVSRARRAGVDPDPERLQSTVVQALTGLPLDPGADVDHTVLARTWLRDSGRRLLPFGLGDDGARRSPVEVIGTLSDLDVGLLARP